MNSAIRIATFDDVVRVLHAHADVPTFCIYVWVEWQLNPDTNEQMFYGEWRSDYDDCAVRFSTDNKVKSDALYKALDEVFEMPKLTHRVFLRAKKDEMPMVDASAKVVVR